MNGMTPDSGKAVKSLERLRSEFPLEARVARASEPARATYARILARWLDAGAPAASQFPARDLDELAALDAALPIDGSVSAYPFSARDTGISARLRGQRLGVMCAIDALAVPLLADATVTIEASCEHCQKPIVLDAHADGSWSAAGVTPPIRVRYPSRRDPTSPCCSDLCPTIRFVFAGCETGCADEYLDLDDAIVVARGMFAFQVPMIREAQKRLAIASP